MIKSLRLYWRAASEEHGGGWFLDTPFLMTQAHLRSVINKYLLPRQINRFRSLPPSDKRDQLKEGIEQLQRGEVQQRLVDSRGGTDGDLLVFAAKKPEGHQQYSILGR